MSSRKLSDISIEGPRQLPPLRSSLSDEIDTSTNYPSRDGLLVEPNDQKVNTSEQHLPSFHHIHDVVIDPSLSLESPRVAQTSLSTMTAQSAVEVPANTAQQGIKPETGEPSVSFVQNGTYVPASGQVQFDGQSDEVTAEVGSTRVSTMVDMKREDSALGIQAKAETAVPENGCLSTPQSVTAKKRSAPKEKKIEKKGIASAIKRPSAKKRKLDPDSVDGTSISQRSGTPASSRASKTPVPRNRKQGSATPMQSSPAPMSKDIDTNEDEDVDDDSELFCICRKPDDHTWMIGCDGGCEDWFHGRCVNMNERDGNLIDKYICMSFSLLEYPIC